MPSPYFKRYVDNFNRVRLVELMESCELDKRARNFRASLVVNPITGLAYCDGPTQTEHAEQLAG